MERLARAFPSEVTAQGEAEFFKSSLSRLGEICPSLAYNLAKHKLRGDKYRKYVRAVAAAMLHQPADCQQLRDKLTAACRDCARPFGDSVRSAGGEREGIRGIIWIINRRTTSRWKRI